MMMMMNFRRLQRKGADQIAEILEIDVPSRSLDDATNDEGNDVHAENEEAIAQQIVEKTIDAIVGHKQTKKNRVSLSNFNRVD